MIDHEKVRVLLLESIHPDAVARFEAEGFGVESLRNALDEAELIERIAGVHLLGIRSKTQVTDRVLAAATSLVGIGAFCIGTDQIDLGSASRRGVAVFNAPFSNTRSVVELALAEIIAMTRRLTEKNAGMHAGVWDKAAEGSHEVRGRRLGIVGYGNIGTQLSVLAENLGMHVSFYDTADKLALGNAQRCSTLDELLETSDVVTLHVDGRPGNSGFFGAEQFARMKPGALFLNLSRGIVVDHGALREQLVSGHLAGAAVDVFPKEPKGRGDEFVSELRGLPNVILTPHIGGSTEEAQSDIGDFVANKLAHYVREGNTTLSVNLPSVALPQGARTSRIAHVHRNVPGVLAQVNSILAEHQVNIEGQLLSTRGELGYLLTDIGANYAEDVLEQLRAMDATVRLRVLS
ncbi:phosphoglycerate dehydrogenase [Spirilliplanes yamanashiensis]|uniref:D-3-phosphoglycerate dehydrogenase n=1 Tax=Spirilliplanes yamanashiensis TaxID=42233 RepID=A0A8J3YDM4_9ACTN|nr:phosphoglycerate dehydrogenase [Spirilliplanes yamanashiensis]MDP9816360.1 D-3-phosphoglycerate dehydrogenase [Spirilliplanes yamanashiensis]GIJ05887.1 D-3-phosphoglycerate dehydrogenase [Spirilliplanes yamanashiensis]